jgi:hypothetical protein
VATAQLLRELEQPTAPRATPTTRPTPSEVVKASGYAEPAIGPGAPLATTGERTWPDEAQARAALKALAKQHAARWVDFGYHHTEYRILTDPAA